MKKVKTLPGIDEEITLQVLVLWDEGKESEAIVLYEKWLLAGTSMDRNLPKMEYYRGNIERLIKQF